MEINQQDINPKDGYNPQQSNPEVPPSEEQNVKLWRKRIKDAKAYFEPDFKRMRENMEFAANIQWEGQDSVDDKEGRYIANQITSHVNGKVASLYAKNPEVEAVRRKRLDFQIWDESVETEWQARMTLMSSGGMMTPQTAQAQMLLQDIAQGKAWQHVCDKVGQTLEILYGYQCDTQAPNFKIQVKQLVRRVITCGVGYVRLNYVNDFGHILSSSLTDDSLAWRLKRAKSIMAGINEDEIEDDDPRIEQLRLLVESVQSSVQQGDTTNIEERLEFDFPSATSIIVDPRCKTLKGFVGADWIAQQYILPLDTANSYFELRGEQAVKTGADFVQYAEDSTEIPRPVPADMPQDVAKQPLGCFWEVFDLVTKTHFFICDGWKWYVQEPQPLDPTTNRFWPIFSLTFNDVEVEPGQKTKIFPPSDVQLLKPMQKERNRIGQELREHRKGNRPFHYTRKGWVTEADKEKLAVHEMHELIEMEGLPEKENVNNAIGHWDGSKIEPLDYSTQQLDQDVNLAVGSNQVQQGAPIRHVAATPAVIQEQARISGVSSNVDDLDDLLSELAQSAGEMMLRKFSPQTVTRIVGRGASWPDQQREDFLNELFLQIKAASSGRPNKAVDVANAQQLIPLMLQAGANPWALIKYACKILDANLDPTDFAPMMPPPVPSQGVSQHQGQNHQGGGQRLQAGHPHPGLVGQQSGGQGMMPGVMLGGA